MICYRILIGFVHFVHKAQQNHVIGLNLILQNQYDKIVNISFKCTTKTSDPKLFLLPQKTKPARGFQKVLVRAKDRA